MAQTPVQSDSKAAKKRTRSPAYPYVNLEAAITRAKEFYDKEQRNSANINIAAKHWGFVDGSSSGQQTVAALMSFGLMQDEGTGEKRAVKLTQAALRILLDARPDSTERAELIKQAALSPRIHKQLWDKWGTGLPSDAQLKHTLLFDWETPFNENAVDFFIGEYRSTIAFAKLAESDKVVETEVKEGGGTGTQDAYVPKIGDYVQWEHNGVLGLPEPRKVREFSSDGKFAYVEGQHGAVPVAELIREAAPSGSQQLPVVESSLRVQQSPSKNYMLEYVVPLSDGSKAVFQWPSSLSAEDIEDLKDSLKIVERKITRSRETAKTAEPD
jgi:hypothetical protein